MSMGQNSRDANIRSASQQIPCLLYNPEVHYRAHKSLPLVPILIQASPIHVAVPCWCKIISKIIVESSVENF
jgi:hypothetical protein